MEGLHGEGRPIKAGEYREISVSSGDHMYPNYSCVPTTMPEIVKMYNKNPQGLLRAAWLLREVLNIHPFEDGNGHLSRLLWCFSLVYDGLPFLVTPFPGKHKAYKNYIRCIEKDGYGEHYSKRLYSLTLISVTQSWRNFIGNLKYESSDSYQKIQKWLSDNELIIS